MTPHTHTHTHTRTHTHTIARSRRIIVIDWHMVIIRESIHKERGVVERARRESTQRGNREHREREREREREHTETKQRAHREGEGETEHREETESTERERGRGGESTERKTESTQRAYREHTERESARARILKSTVSKARNADKYKMLRSPLWWFDQPPYVPQLPFGSSVG